MESGPTHVITGPPWYHGNFPISIGTLAHHANCPIYSLSHIVTQLYRGSYGYLGTGPHPQLRGIKNAKISNRIHNCDLKMAANAELTNRSSSISILRMVENVKTTFTIAISEMAANFETAIRIRNLGFKNAKIANRNFYLKDGRNYMLKPHLRSQMQKP